MRVCPRCLSADYLWSMRVGHEQVHNCSACLWKGSNPPQMTQEELDLRKAQDAQARVLCQRSPLPYDPQAQRFKWSNYDRKFLHDFHIRED